LGYGSVIAAGSIVTKDVPSQVLMMGSPAKIIKKIE
jgi:acetyltransferase-like isoleucine patch superfamily enzyme